MIDGHYKFGVVSPYSPLRTQDESYMIAGRYNRSTSLATIEAYFFFFLLYNQRSTNLRVTTW